MAQTPGPTVTPTGADAPDMLNDFAGLAPDSRLAGLRAQRPEVVRYAQGSYRVLLEPDDPAGVSRAEREAIALRVGVLTASPAIAAWHRERLHALGESDTALAAIEQFPDGPAPPRLAAILRHTDRLTHAPGTATPAHLAELKEIGLSPRDIVTISQLIALLSFQVRVLAGLRLLGEES